MTIGLACNIYNDALALPGLLENASSWADDIVIIHAGPNGKASTDGTMEVLERWGIKPIMSRIDDGFGVVRTQCIRESKTDWVMILDADERFHPHAPILSCDGHESYPQFETPNLTVLQDGTYDQKALLHCLMTHHVEAIRTSRRHWFDYSWKHSCQNWQLVPDWQLRIIRNHPDVGYNPHVKIHEALVHLPSGREVTYTSEQQGAVHGLYFDHYHCFWKAQEPDQRLEDIQIYNALHKGCTETMWVTLGYK